MRPRLDAKQMRPTLLTISWARDSMVQALHSICTSQSAAVAHDQHTYLLCHPSLSVGR
jgi:hypothetical protein